ncbi:MAG TPA: EF-P beta-lysylation protein EpmB [Pirellulales bacterium]|nr:EF-P beta-lysylation protein EpmB [Pirellulales bacterium]
MNEPTILTLPRDQPRAELAWQRAMKEAVRDPAELCRILRLSRNFEQAAQTAARQFPLFAPRGYIARMRPGDPADPLLRQVLPIADEMLSPSRFVTDPVDDHSATVVPGLLHKYTGRVLMITTGACAIHCRYCFRRHFPYGDAPHSLDEWARALDAIAADDSIHEVILSGGDPLTLVDSRLAQLAAHVANIPHVRRLRIHTRLPIVIPERVTSGLVEWLRGTRLAPIMVVHANHAAELDASVADALARLIDAGIPVLNQAVLLRGVNDSAEAQVALCERLVDLRVLPYYLHQLDRVAGAAHFEVPESLGHAIIRELRTRLPGYAVPCYVREIPGASHKVEV